MTEYLMAFLLPFLGILAASFIVAAAYQAIHTGQIFYPKPKLPITGRKKEIRDLVRKIMTGQSSAIIGAFGNERTEILNTLRNPELYGDDANRFIFSLLDVSTLEKECSRAQFWEHALEPLQDKITNETDSAVFEAYQFCQESDFKNRSLEKLFERMKQNDWRLVLLINRFEEILNREFLNDEVFLGNLRLLASSYPSPLSLVIALNESFRQFYEGVKELPKGSPYLNFLESGLINLGSVAEEDIDEFIGNSDPRFTQADRKFIKESTGGHPYLLQRATAILMEAYNNQETKPLDSAKVIFTEEAENMLTNILRFWPQQLCETFVLVAQKQKVSDNFEFEEELKELNKQGFIKQENGQWQIRSSVFADLMSNKVVQKLCQQKQTNAIH